MEDRRVLAPIILAAEEQLLLELINRARANPVAEAALHGVSLNEGLPAGTISPEPKQPLAPHQALIEAAGDHADDMLARDYFSHNTPEGDTPSMRAMDAGYPGGAGENIAWGGSTGAIDELAHVYERHRGLFRSPGHRENLLNDDYVDVGVGVRYGRFTSQGATYNASMVVENFGFAVGGQITGVAFTDLVTPNDFYDVGEGVGGLTITARNAAGAEFATQTGPSGGYTLPAPAGTYTVTASGDSLATPIVINNVRHDLDDFENTKVDFVTTAASPPDVTAPTATATAANISQAGNTPQTMVVTYFDDREIDISSIDANDLIVIAPTGGSLAVTVHSVTPLNGANSQVRVEYRLAPPSGTWDSSDNGLYSVRLQAAQVYDGAGNAVAGRQLTSFTVQLGQLTLAWHNAANPADVNNRDGVTTADLLLVVSYLREHPPGPLPPIVGPPMEGYIDVTGNGEATLADLLAVVTELRAILQGDGEAEAEGILSAAAVDRFFRGAPPEPWLQVRFDDRFQNKLGALTDDTFARPAALLADSQRGAAQGQVRDVMCIAFQHVGDEFAVSAREEHLGRRLDFFAKLDDEFFHGAGHAPEQAAF